MAFIDTINKKRILCGLTFSVFGLITWLLIGYLTSNTLESASLIQNLGVALAKFWEFVHYPVSVYFLPIIDGLGTHSSEITKYKYLYVAFCLVQDFLMGFLFSFLLLKKKN